MATDGMNYEETGEQRTKLKTAERSVFRNLSTSNIIIGVVTELYRRYGKELWQLTSIIELAIIIWLAL